MIIIETPKKSVDQEIDRLYAMISEFDDYQTTVENSFLAGAVAALVWLRDGLPMPSTQLPDLRQALKAARD